MRKYFLLSAVALLATSTANAKTDYAGDNARATIEVAGDLNCEDIDWGTIVVKRQNEAFTIDSSGKTNSSDLISISGRGDAECMGAEWDVYTFSSVTDTKLTNENGDEITLTNITHDTAFVKANLNIPAHVQPGEYTGSFTVTQTY